MPLEPVPWRMVTVCGLNLIKQSHIGKELQIFLTLIKELIIFTELMVQPGSEH